MDVWVINKVILTTLFVKKELVTITALIVYVNDIVVIASDTPEVAKLNKHLAKNLEIKDLDDCLFPEN